MRKVSFGNLIRLKPRQFHSAGQTMVSDDELGFAKAEKNSSAQNGIAVRY